MKRFQNIFHLGIKELRGLQHDTVMLSLVVFAFSFGVYGPAKGTGSELTNAAIAIADEYQSQLSERINNAFFPPAFQAPRRITPTEATTSTRNPNLTFSSCKETGLCPIFLIQRQEAKNCS